MRTISVLAAVILVASTAWSQDLPDFARASREDFTGMEDYAAKIGDPAKFPEAYVTKERITGGEHPISFAMSPYVRVIPAQYIANSDSKQSFPVFGFTLVWNARALPNDEFTFILVKLGEDIYEIPVVQRVSKSGSTQNVVFRDELVDSETFMITIQAHNTIPTKKLYRAFQKLEGSEVSIMLMAGRYSYKFNLRKEEVVIIKKFATWAPQHFADLMDHPSD